MLAKFSGVESERTAFTVLCKRNDSELSFQTKIRRLFGASIVLVPAKFRKLGDEPKRKFILSRNNVFNLNFLSVEYESPTRRKGIEAQTCEIFLLRLFKSQGFAFCHTFVISK